MSRKMELKKNVKIETDDFWYDLFEGGYIDPEEILADKKDVEKVLEAIDILDDFRDSCEEIIELG